LAELCREFGLQEFSDDPTLRNTTDRILARARIIPRVAQVIKGWNVADLSAKLDELNICFSPINRPEDLLRDPHVLRPAGWCRISMPTVPRSGFPRCRSNGMAVISAKDSKYRVGADTEKVRAELERQNRSSTTTLHEA